MPFLDPSVLTPSGEHESNEALGQVLPVAFVRVRPFDGLETFAL
jgi:hypothetical protein